MSGHNEETSSQKVTKELILTKGRHAAIYERPVQYQSAIWQWVWGFYQCPAMFACLHRWFFYSMNLKWLIENQTFLTVCFHLPKLSPRSDRIVNSLCCLRCKGHHSTVLRCPGTRGLEGQLSSQEGYQLKISPTQTTDAFSMTDVWHQVHLPQIQSVSCLYALARQQAVGKLSRQSSTRWIKQNHLLSWDQQSLQI